LAVTTDTDFGVDSPVIVAGVVGTAAAPVALSLPQPVIAPARIMVMTRNAAVFMQFAPGKAGQQSVAIHFSPGHLAATPRYCDWGRRIGRSSTVLRLDRKRH
jgi:hypothetical protein